MWKDERQRKNISRQKEQVKRYNESLQYCFPICIKRNMVTHDRRNDYERIFCAS